MPGKPRRFEPEELVKVTLRVPKDMYDKTWKYARRYGFSFNEAAVRLMAFGVGDSEFGDREVMWTSKFFAEFQKSELFLKLRDAFREVLAEFLVKYYERDPVTLLKEIITYAGSHFDYFQEILTLERDRLAKAIAGDNPEAEEKLVEFFEMLKWVWDWVRHSHKSKRPKNAT
ncbi:MAG: hypothetical protein ACUVXA_06385 [Candidatus Jordarchaeum sp.]|uniref:hypothetical protein n=1 Tax=Candidatus Jordarchaeum sp. TaxID=2823881 RepID=UPI004049B0BB